MSILSMSITGGVMILVVVLIRALLLERLPKKTFLVLWGLVMLRLLVPFQVSSKGSIYNLLPSNNQVLTPMIPAINTTAPILDIPPIPLTINSAVNNISPITIVWVAGILLILLCTTFVYMRSMRNMKTSLPCENTYVENWLQSISLKRKIQVRVLDRIKTPLTYGLIHPVILLPKNMDYSNEHQLLAILTHEYIHIKRFDNIKKIIMVFTLSIHWFNPLVWVMFVLCNRDIELACDEKVLLDLGHDTRVTYALTLVELSEQCNAFSLTSGFSKNALEERVKAIMKHKKMTAFTVAIVIVLIIGVTAVFATTATAKNNVESIAVTQEYEKLMDLKVDGYENMTIAEFLSSVWNAIGDNDIEYFSLIDKAFNDEELRNTRYSDENTFFITEVLIPLVGDAWQTKETGGSIIQNGIQIEYQYEYNLLNADAIRINDFIQMKKGIEKDVSNLTKGRMQHELANNETMQLEFESSSKAWQKNYGSEFLQIDIIYASYWFEESDSNEPFNSEERGDAGTADDYAIVLALKTAGFQNMTVADFLDLYNNTIAQEADMELFERIGRDISYDDIQVPITPEEISFITTTFRATGDEFAVEHQKRFGGNRNPYISYTANREITEDEEIIFEVTVDYDISYVIPNGKDITIGERDHSILGVANGVQAFVNSRSEEELNKGGQAAMQAEIDRLLEKFSNTKIQLTVENLSYQVWSWDGD